MLNIPDHQVEKLCFLAILLLPLFISIETLGQKKLPDVILSIDAENATLSQLLSLITEKTGLPFSYNPKRIPVQQETSYKATDKHLQGVLNDLSAEFGLVFEPVENQIVLKPDKRSGKVAAQTFTLSGTIRDANTGDALIGASVYISESQTGTVTNPFGFYSITLPAGTYTVS